MIIPIKERDRSEIVMGPGVQGISVAPPSESRIFNVQNSFSGRNGEFQTAEFHSSDGKRRFLYSPPQGRPWKHPWSLDLYWSEDLVDAFGESLPAGWGVKVRPGFVNGIDPVVSSAPRIKAYSEDPAPGMAWTDAPGLLDEPLISLEKPSSWKTPESVPYLIKAYFANLLFDDKSVASAKNKIKQASEEGGRMTGGGFADRLFELATEFDETIASGYEGATGSSYRQILRTEFYLIVNRVSYKKEVIAGTLFSESESIVSFDTLGVSQNPRARIAFGNVVRGEGNGPLNAAGKPYDPFKLGGGTDDGIDYLRLGTIYAISPEKETRYVENYPEYDLSETPGKDWEMYVQHDVFWNIEHRARNLLPITLKPSGIAGAMFSAAAAAGPLGVMAAAPIIATNNMMNGMITDRLTDMLNNKQNTGLFWTI